MVVVSHVFLPATYPPMYLIDGCVTQQSVDCPSKGAVRGLGEYYSNVLNVHVCTTCSNTVFGSIILIQTHTNGGKKDNNGSLS